MKTLWAWACGLAAVVIFVGYGLFYFSTLIATTSSAKTHMILPSLQWTSPEAFVSFVVLVWGAAAIGGLCMAIVCAFVFKGLATSEPKHIVSESANRYLQAAA